MFTIADGEKIAQGKCASCHSFAPSGANKTGPGLWNIFGNKLASKESFAYSKAFYESEITGWDYNTLYEFLKNPRAYIPGTKMSFAGLRKEEQRAAVILFLRSLSDKEFPLPEVEIVDAESEDGSGATE